MSNEIRFRIFEMLATHHDELSLNHVLRDLEKSYDILYIADVVIDMVTDNQVAYYSFHSKRKIYPTDNCFMYLNDRIEYYDD